MDYGNWERREEQFQKIWNLEPTDIDIDIDEYVLRPLPIRTASDFPDIPDDVPVEDPPSFPDIDVEIEDE